MQRTVLITGCSSGIGLVAAQDLKNRGYRVLAACRKPDDVAKMMQWGLEGIELDLDDCANVERAAAQVIQLTNGRLYGLFNNGGFGLYGPLHTLSRQQLEKQFSTNLFGTHQLTQLLLPAMLPHGEGRIIQTSSVMGLVSTPGRGAYAASKHALEAWSDTLRMELHGSGINVCLIEPGSINTHFTQNVNQTEADKPINNPGIAQRFTLPPQAILPKLRHALESPRPQLRYPVTLLAHALTILRRILPGRLLDKVLRGNS
ncbi:MAG: SDR family oxidoreductase [Yersinia sp. (in: enterobacteria)]